MVTKLLISGVSAIFIVSLASGGCNLFNDFGNAECSLANQGQGGDDGAGGDGAGGDDNDGVSSGEGVGGAQISGSTGSTASSATVGAGGAPGASSGAGASDSSGIGAGSARTPPRAPQAVARIPRRIRHGSHHENVGTAVSADCTPLVAVPALPPPPNPPNWIGLDTGTLRQIAIQKNINGCASQTGVTQNRTIGVTFETWVLKTLGQLVNPPGRWTMPIFSQAREQRNIANGNGGLPASVIPEFVGDQITFHLDAPLNLTWDYFPNSMFYEVKAVAAPLVLSTSKYQILGLLDVATSFPTVPTGSHAPPLVMFTTTANTVVSQGVVDQALAWRVAVWQQVVQYDANSANPNNPNLRIAAPTCLTPSLYPTLSSGWLSLVWIDPGTPWPINPLTWPTNQEQDDVGAVPDPDSPAVVP